MTDETIITAYVNGNLVEQRDGGHKAIPRVVKVSPPERLERVAHRCGVIDEHGQPCPTWTLRDRCYRHVGTYTPPRASYEPGGTPLFRIASRRTPRPLASAENVRFF